MKILQFKLVLLTDFSVGSTGTGGVLTVGNRAGSTLHGHANIVSITGPGMPNDTGGGVVALPPQNGGATYQGVSRVAITSAYMNVGVITNFHAPVVLIYMNQELQQVLQLPLKLQIV